MDALSGIRLVPLNVSSLPDASPGGLQPGKIPGQELGAIAKVGGIETQGVSGSSFSDVLTGMVREVSAKQAAAGDAVEGVLSGQNVPLHQAMIAMEEASVSFQLMVEVRNKLLESYQELMRMQI